MGLEYQWSRVDPVTHELVFLAREGRGSRYENQYVCALSFRGEDRLQHICDLELSHDGPCFCDVHRVVGPIQLEG